MSDPYAGPFEVGGGDGRDYFVVLPPEPLLINAFLTLEKARVEALKNPNRVEGRARAAAISLVISEVGTGVKEAAVLTAQQAEQMIEHRVNATQKRPDPPGKSLGRRLKDGIVCRPLPTVLPGGGVGIGDLSVLNQVADAQGRAYWRAQEFGSSHLVGRIFPMLFQPGNSLPDAGEFRKHPILEVSSEGALAEIRNPIPEKAFLREGAVLAEAFRQRALGTAVSAGIGQLRQITAGAAANLPALRRIVR
jgi:hypothetical protein